MSKRFRIRAHFVADELNADGSVKTADFLNYNFVWADVPLAGVQVMQETLAGTMISWGEGNVTVRGEKPLLDTARAAAAQQEQLYDSQGNPRGPWFAGDLYNKAGKLVKGKGAK